VTRVALVIAIAVAVGHRADAQPARGRPSAKDLAAARAHFRDAEAAKARGDYRTAAIEYLAAYELFEEPEFFFDVAEVDRLAGDEADALTYYEKYLELDPNGRGAAAARASADALRRSIAAKEDAAKHAADAAKHADDPQPVATTPPVHDTPPVHEPPPPQALPPAPPAPPPRGGRGLRLAGLGVGALGVASIAGGVGFGLRARSIAGEASQWTTFDPDRYTQGKAAQRDMAILTGVGAAAVIAGGVLYYLGHREAERADEAALAVAPAVDPSSISLTVTGHF
jgi:tetratricopeptide (TPR) repeat protein